MSLLERQALKRTQLTHRSALALQEPGEQRLSDEGRLHHGCFPTITSIAASIRESNGLTFRALERVPWRRDPGYCGIPVFEDLVPN